MKQKARVVLGIVFALACGVLTWLLAGAPEFHPPAVETVRVIVEDREYHIPAQLAPSFDPSDAVESWWDSGTHYSQEADEPPPRVSWFLIPTHILKRLSKRDASLSRLGDLSYLSITEPNEVKEVLEKEIDSCQIPRQPGFPEGHIGTLSMIGNFRAEEANSRLYLRQTLPSFTPITAWCSISIRKHKSKPDERSLLCKARQRTPLGSCIEISFSSRSMSIEALEDTFDQAKRLVGPLVCDARLGAAPNSCK